MFGRESTDLVELLLGLLLLLIRGQGVAAPQNGVLVVLAELRRRACQRVKWYEA